MKSKRLPKPTRQDKAWQQRVEKQVKAEKVELNHPQGKQRFENVIKLSSKKKP